MSLLRDEKTNYAALQTDDDDIRHSHEELLDQRPCETPLTTIFTVSEARWRQRFLILAILSLSTISILIAVTVALSSKSKTCPSATPGATIPYCKSHPRTSASQEPVLRAELYTAPAPLKWVNKDLKPDMRFMGQPRLEMDEAWHALMEGTMIRFSADELRRANNATSVKHVDGTGYVGGLGVSHSLHCLVGFTPIPMTQPYYEKINSATQQQIHHQPSSTCENVPSRRLSHLSFC
jgi:hypothetical protein